jgi:hypothetical protein
MTTSMALPGLRLALAGIRARLRYRDTHGRIATPIPALHVTARRWTNRASRASRRFAAVLPRQRVRRGPRPARASPRPRPRRRPVPSIPALDAVRAASSRDAIPLCLTARALRELEGPSVPPNPAWAPATTDERRCPSYGLRNRCFCFAHSIRISMLKPNPRGPRTPIERNEHGLPRPARRECAGLHRDDPNHLTYTDYFVLQHESVR